MLAITMSFEFVILYVEDLINDIMLMDELVMALYYIIQLSSDYL